MPGVCSMDLKKPRKAAATNGGSPFDLDIQPFCRFYIGTITVRDYTTLDRFNETDHMRSAVIPGAPPKVASPESIILGQYLWIRVRRFVARRNDTAHDA